MIGQMGRATGEGQTVALARREGIETERKYLLLTQPSQAVLAQATRTLAIEQIYLPKNGTVKPRLRRIVENGEVTFMRTEKERLSPMSQIEAEEPISETQWLDALAQRDRSRSTIHKQRYLFETGAAKWELDHLTSPVDVWLLEIELPSEHSPVFVPEMFGPVREVTFVKGFSNRRIAGGSLFDIDYARL